jgi:hypothetical protein
MVNPFFCNAGKKRVDHGKYNRYNITTGKILEAVLISYSLFSYSTVNRTDAQPLGYTGYAIPLRNLFFYKLFPLSQKTYYLCTSFFGKQ